VVVFARVKGAGDERLRVRFCFWRGFAACLIFLKNGWAVCGAAKARP
jgi:hypothetical protein